MPPRVVGRVRSSAVLVVAAGTHNSLGRCPSGQREQAVNLPGIPPTGGSNPPRAPCAPIWAGIVPTRDLGGLRDSSWQEAADNVEWQGSRPMGRRDGERYRTSCMTATSSQRLNLRPTSRSMPTSSNPQRSCRARLAGPTGLDAGQARRGTRRLWPTFHDVGRAGGGRCPRRPAFASHVHRVLHRGAVLQPAPRTATATRAPTTTPAPDDSSTATMAEERPRAGLANHARCSGERAGNEVERGRRGRDLEVWNTAWIAAASVTSARRMRRSATAPDGYWRPLVPAGIVLTSLFASGLGRQPPVVAATGRRDAVGLAAAGRGPVSALLAQSVEHSHGKAGVVGSIPTEGSDQRRHQVPGGVAQLVRASGS